MRRLALFGATVLFPCGLLLVFGLILIRQDRELARRHLEDQRRANALQERQNRLARLEQIKAAAAQDFFAGRRPVVDFVGLVMNDAVPEPQSASTEPASLAACERDEFAADRRPQAITCYERALAASRGENRRYAQLLLGRALLRAGNTRREVEVDRDLLAAPLDAVDDQGIPFAFYAADRLLRAGAFSAAIAKRFSAADAARAANSVPAAYLLQSIADRLGDTALRQQSAASVDRARQSESLRSDIPGLLPLLRRAGPDPVWIEHGPWQVGLDRAPESGKELVIAVASRRLLPVPTPLSIPPIPSRTGIYTASLGLVIVIGISGSYLLWRDVRRDVQVAAIRSQFVASVSHELKTPLTAIRMFAETLRLRPAGDAVARDEYLDTIIHESERLSRLVDNVLDFSKIEQGRKLYHLRRTSPASVIDAAVRAVRYPLEAAGFTLRVDAADPLPELNADPDALQQAVLNLLANAIKYSGARKEIELAARADSGAIVIAVRDFGVGIPAEHRQRIFERFYRVPSAENERVPGAGLGLTLVAHIAAAHGGAVTVESEPGGGSLFSLRLPVEQAV